jgi:hypothetical protein
MARTILEAALHYAQRGLPVFPVNPLNKRPFITGGFKVASADEQLIRDWWQQWPKAMIGMPTGTVSKLWVLDADVDPGKRLDGIATLAKLAAKHGSLPATLTSLTPRGGKHFLFTWNGVDIRNSTSQIGRGIDVRGEGGYITLPPSRRADGARYRWEKNGASQAVVAPDWLIELAKPRDRSKAWAQAALDRECGTVTNALAGQRNHTLNIAAFNLFQIVYGGGLDEQTVRDRLFEAAEACGLVSDDGAQTVWATIDSAANAARNHPRTRPSAQHQRAPNALPRIRLLAGELPAIVDQAEQALLASNVEFYQRGGLIVRPVRSQLKAADDRQTLGWQLLPVERAHMVETLTRVANFEKMDQRARAFVPKDCPDQVAETYLARVGHWCLPVLLGVVNAPFLRRDGSICEQPGYDADSGLLFRPDGQSFPSIAANPTLDDAKKALSYLETLLKEFPFVAAVDHAVALSAILTPFDRRSLATAPLHAFTSPVAGTGKSLLVDVASMLVSGQLAPVISQGRSEEELEKRLGAALIAGDPLISIDNCEHPLAGVFLCQCITQQRCKIRLLGHSRHVETPINATIFTTGNNLVIASDLTRRTLLCSLDADCEQPELRDFNVNVLDVIRSERGRLVAAVLTILRAWHLARTAIGVQPLGSFEDWSRRIREPLLWLDQSDPCESIKTVRESDPDRAALYAVLEQWKRVLGTQSAYSTQEIVNRAVVEPDFLAALAAVAATAKGGMLVSNERLGRWLRRVRGNIVNKLKLIDAGSRSGYPLWKLIEG